MLLNEAADILWEDNAELMRIGEAMAGRRVMETPGMLFGVLTGLAFVLSSDGEDEVLDAACAWMQADTRATYMEARQLWERCTGKKAD